MENYFPEVDWDMFPSDNDNKGEKHNTMNHSTINANTHDIVSMFAPVAKLNKYIVITKSGAFIKFEFFKKQDRVELIKKLKSYFTVRHRNLLGYTEEIVCASIEPQRERIIVPRFGVFEVLTKRFGLEGFSTASQLKIGDQPKTPFQWIGTQSKNQELLSDEIISNHFSYERAIRGSAGVIVNLEAGQGKSYLAAYLMCAIQRKTAIIVHSTALLSQWATVLRRCIENVNIGYYHGKTKVDGDVIIMVMNSAAGNQFVINKKLYTNIEFYNRFGLIIFDECHMLCTETGKKILGSAQAPYMLGLSATPDDHIKGFNSMIYWGIGPVLNAKDLPGYDVISTSFKGTVHRMMYYGPQEYTMPMVNETTGLTSISKTINMICQDSRRNDLIIDCIVDGLNLGLYMFVFADRRDYLDTLCKMLKKMRGISGSIIENDTDFKRIVGGDKEEILENAEKKSKVIFTTYQYMGTGKSIIKMNGLVMATPRKSKMAQYINRIFRLGSDQSIERHIWDICDMKISLASQWATRKMYYLDKGYPIIERKVSHTKNNDNDEIKKQLKVLDNAKIKKSPMSSDTNGIECNDDTNVSTNTYNNTHTHNNTNNNGILYDNMEDTECDTNDIVNKLLNRLRPS